MDGSEWTTRRQALCVLIETVVILPTILGAVICMLAAVKPAGGMGKD